MIIIIISSSIMNVGLTFRCRLYLIDYYGKEYMMKEIRFIYCIWRIFYKGPEGLLLTTIHSRLITAHFNLWVSHDTIPANLKFGNTDID